ncbi:MAG: response regulator transcription factor [Sediminibacterium sp.]|nr:response regulator transcription factor [Sediminibacterium sp.]MBX9778824.1 response regulator transcription factor [Chitinophagaceae bacterium]
MKILIADDHTLIREGLKKILLESLPFATIHDVGDSADLFKRAIKETWDIIISDISMPGYSGIEILKQIKTHAPNTPVLMLSMYPPEQYAVRAIKAGASGYLTKESAPYELVTAVQQILRGRKYITNRVAEVLAGSLENDGTKLPHENLSDREFEVLRMIVEGKSISEIGECLSLNVNTISTYRSRIMDKMNIRNNADLVKYAIEHKLF